MKARKEMQRKDGLRQLRLGFCDRITPSSKPGAIKVELTADKNRVFVVNSFRGKHRALHRRVINQFQETVTQSVFVGKTPKSDKSYGVLKQKHQEAMYELFHLWVEGGHRLISVNRQPRAFIVTTANRLAKAICNNTGGRSYDYVRNVLRDLSSIPIYIRVAIWGARLAPGLAGAATHGVIRAAHAARALGVADTKPRRSELAAGLAYWAATYQALPSAEPEGEAPVSASAALASVPMVRDRLPEVASIVQALCALDDHPAFAPVIHRLDVRRDADEVVTDLTATFARVLLASAQDRLGAIVFTHGVTSNETLRTLLPLLPAEVRPAALRFAWQAGAALHATYGLALPAEAGEPADAPAADELVEAAIACGDDHAIKLTAACLGEHARSGSPVYLAAARQGIDRLS
ncbi:MAG: hypothetical protein AAF471_08095 [Myxococcota bacterium]